jgi:hypothetical protein
VSVSRVLIVLLGLSAAGRPALAQPDSPAGYPRPSALNVGGEVAAAVAPRDDTAFFNYTDYGRSALRLVRLRLFGEWRLPGRVSLVAEARTESIDDVEAAAAYVRWRPWATRDIDVQVGRIPPVIGAFARRAYGRDNAVVGLPLPYQYLTALRPDALPATVGDLLLMRGRGWQPSFPIGSHELAPGIALLSASRWDTGAQLRWRDGAVELAGAVTRGAPAVPVVRETNQGLQWSGRASATLPGGWSAGVSGARGQWIEDGVLELVPVASRGRSTQSVVAADAEFGAGRWLLRGEALRSVFDVPLAASGSRSLSAWAVFAEARYRPHPRWHLAARLERLRFGDVAGTDGAPTAWDFGVDRVEAIVGYRLTRAVDLRAGWQGDWRQGGRVRVRHYPVAQILYWF